MQAGKGMTVREIQREDLQALAEMEKESFPDFWTIGQLSGTLSRMDFCGVIVEDKGEAVGYLLGTSLFETAEIDRIAVRKRERKKGVGKMLIDSFAEAVKKRNAEKIFLEVRVSNTPACALYRKCGFSTFKIRERYYVDGEDALEMVNVLK